MARAFESAQATLTLKVASKRADFHQNTLFRGEEWKALQVKTARSDFSSQNRSCV
jgi:hypothetical protein